MDAFHNASLSLAVIGIGGRFPGSRSLEEWWNKLAAGVEMLTFFSEDELAAAGVSAELRRQKNYVPAAAVIDGEDLFDASFFGFTPREAEVTDPQLRLFLECAHEVLDLAGYGASRYRGRTGVFAGCSLNSYLLGNLMTNPAAAEALGASQVMFRNDKDHLPTLASYKLDLKGPSVNVQAACSTSLVAVHLACQSVLHGECDMALAGGASIRVPQRAGYLHQADSISSPDGHCRPFDARAAGTIFGNGVGIVLIRRLSDALQAGDTIRAVIRGSAINNDGSLKAGYTAPSASGQSDVILEALSVAQVNPETIGYVEAHGTATTLGDPIEIEALTEAYRTFTERKNFCGIGSVKSNLGHLDTAAGIAGFLKTVLQLEHGQITPSLHFEQPNPRIDFDTSPFFVNDRLRNWEPGATPRRAAVSSFGIGGTNSHVVLEEAPPPPPLASSRPYQILPLSAKSDAALDEMSRNLGVFLESHPDQPLADVSFTLQVGREAYTRRQFLVGQTNGDVSSALLAGDPNRIRRGQPQSHAVAFLFPGQGAQHGNMCRGLYEREPAFRETFDYCADLFQAADGVDLRSIVYPAEFSNRFESDELTETRIAQPALFIVEYALATLWMEWGIHPDAMAGHSIGEYVAACLAGVMTPDEAIRLVAARARLMQSTPRGAMLAVAADPAELGPLLNGKLSIAAVNGPRLSVVSGPNDAVDELETLLGPQGLQPRRLQTSHAFHSAMMDSILDEFAREAAKVQLKPPQLRYISNLTATWIRPEQATNPAYWVRHLRETVRFGDGIGELLEEPGRILLEVGPGQTLRSLARNRLKPADQQLALSSLPHRRKPDPDMAQMLETLGQLWIAGLPVDWQAFSKHERRRRIPLPTYAFQRKRYWIEPGNAAVSNGRPKTVAAMKPNVEDWFCFPSWKRTAPARSGRVRDKAASPRKWLVFEDKSGLGAALAAHLRLKNDGVVSVRPGPTFSRLSGSDYEIDPARREDYVSLIAELARAEWSPSDIIHAWSFSLTPATHPGAVDYLDSLGFSSLLFLVQALGGRSPAVEMQIAIVTNGLSDVTGVDAQIPEKSVLLGPARVIPLEHPHLKCRIIDIAPNSGDWEEEAVRLAAELDSESTEPICAYRGPYRWAPTYEPVRLPPAGEHESRLRRRGVYLITGGLGGIGLEIARRLAEKYQARLVLAGRASLPPREEWDAWLSSHTDEEKTSRRITRLRELETLGAEVEAVAADVTNYRDMRGLFERIDQRFGELHGVIHAAGVAGAGIMQLKEIDAARRVMEPKITGTRILASFLTGRRPDFLLLCSSITSVLGGIGQVDYCAANAFLDAFASQYTRSTGIPTIAVNWDAWKETGMAVETQLPAALAQMREENLRHAIPTREGMDAFQRILAADLAQVVVSPRELEPRLRPAEPAHSPTEEAQDPLAERNASSPARRTLPGAFAPPRHDVDRVIVSIWQELLGVDELGVDDDFFELGGHSLLAIQVVSRLRETLNAEITLASFFEATTVAKLSDLIIERQQIPGQIEKTTQLLIEIAGMSAEDVQNALDQRRLANHA